MSSYWDQNCSDLALLNHPVFQKRSCSLNPRSGEGAAQVTMKRCWDEPWRAQHHHRPLPAEHRRAAGHPRAARNAADGHTSCCDFAKPAFRGCFHHHLEQSIFTSPPTPPLKERLLICFVFWVDCLITAFFTIFQNYMISVFSGKCNYFSESLFLLFFF